MVSMTEWISLSAIIDLIMQPNQQQSQSQNTLTEPNSDSLPYKVPDYLHLDPMIGQPPKSRKGLKIMISIAATIVLLVVASTWLWIVSHPSPEQRLYSALGNLLRTNYVHREISVTKPDSKGFIKVVADSDFSIPDSPKSSLTYSYYGGKETQNKLVTGELVTVDSTYYTGRITTALVNLPYDLKLNQWYTDTPSHLNPNYNPDIFGIYTDSNSSVGAVVIGNYSTKKPDGILERLRTGGVYMVESARTKSRSGEEYTEYVIKVDYKKLNDLVKKINSDLKMKLVPTTVVSTDVVEMLVSNKTGKITEIIENINQQNLQVRVQATFSYPENVSIKLPVGVKIGDKL